jgi:cytochrome oxidase Cu insertion factor (SCO1/SenC/PrrC family)
MVKWSATVPLLLFICLLAMSIFSRIAGLGLGGLFGGATAAARPSQSIFDFEVEQMNGQSVSLSQYKGKKAFLVVNVASK